MARTKKSPARLDREIAAALAPRQPELAALFADPKARATFAEEMRHEIYKRQAAEQSAALHRAKPYTVKGLETVGRQRVRSLFGRFATEAEARSKADSVEGWVEHDGRIIYGREKQSEL
jgi:hypothetical protein